MKFVISRAPQAIGVRLIAARENSHYHRKTDLAYADAMAAQRIAEREELQRMFQGPRLIHTSELPTVFFLIDYLEAAQFSRSYKFRHEKPFLSAGIPLGRRLQSPNLARSLSSRVARASDFAPADNSSQLGCP
jgi:hypothetical protein